MNLYTDPRLTALGIVHGTTDRCAGNMRLAENTGALFKIQGIEECHIARFKQIHSDRLLRLSSAAEVRALQRIPIQEADGWILHGNGLGAAILTADCVPLFMWDETAQVLALAHCGWRAVAAGLPAKTARQLRKAGAEGKLSAWAGPHIQACCFEVQNDVASQFPRGLQKHTGKQFVDLNKEIQYQLLQEGLEEKDIVFSKHCTCCEAEHFFSFRRDHQKDALLSFVYKP